MNILRIYLKNNSGRGIPFGWPAKAAFPALRIDNGSPVLSQNPDRLLTIYNTITLPQLHTPTYRIRRDSGHS